MVGPVQMLTVATLLLIESVPLVTLTQYFFCVVAAGVRYVLASVVSYLVSNVLMYLGNRYFTFRLGNDGFWSAYARYLLVGLVVVAMNAAVLALLVEGLGLDETLAQALSLLAVTPPAYVMFKRWTFRLGS
jgi:putative flippase GtrA